MKKIYFTLFISILFILSCEDKKDPAPPEDTTPHWLTFDHTNSPLPQEGVFTVVLDLDGNVWASTLGKGLFKYNGAVWEHFDTSNSGLASNQVSTLALESNGNMWIGYWDIKDLALYNGTSIVNYNLDSLTTTGRNDSHSLVVDLNGVVWSGTHYGPLIRLDDNGSIEYHPDSIGSVWGATIMTLGVDSHNNLWFSGIELVRYDGLSWQKFDFPNDFGWETSIALAIDQNDNIWIGSDYNKLVKFDGVDWSVYNTDFIYSIAIDGSNTIWLGTRNSGLVSYDGSIWTEYSVENSGIPWNKVNSVYCDQGIIWMSSRYSVGDGAGSGGLARLVTP